MKHTGSIYSILLIVLCLGLSSRTVAQQIGNDSTGYTTQIKATRVTHWLGLGGTKLKDTYLSPLNYGGLNISYLGERSLLKSRRLPPHDLSPIAGLTPREVLPRQMWSSSVAVSLATTDNPAGNASIYRIQGRGNLAHLFRLYHGELGRIYMGPALTLGIGGLYNSRNGNNPATFKADLALGLAAQYSYQLPSPSFPMQIRCVLQADALGVAFSEQFGESYYELYYLSHALGKRFYTTHWGNSFAIRSLLSATLPIKDWLHLSVGCLVSTQSLRLNSLQIHIGETSLLIGITSYRLPLAGRAILHKQAAQLPL